jgi:hypothetical protein
MLSSFSILFYKGTASSHIAIAILLSNSTYRILISHVSVDHFIFPPNCAGGGGATTETLAFSLLKYGVYKFSGFFTAISFSKCRYFVK